VKIILLYIIFVESSLELIPKSFETDPFILKYAKKVRKNPNNLILDISNHNKIIRRLKNHEKRGRPDIIHQCLLYALNTPLNRIGQLLIYIHTINDQIIKVNPELRIARNYNRFIGIMEQLFRYGKVPPRGAPLLEIEQISLGSLISQIKANEVLILTENGTPTLINDLFKDTNIKKSYIILIGAFAKGYLRKNILNLSTKRIKIFPEPLDSLIVLSKIINGYENAIKLYENKLNL